MSTPSFLKNFQNISSLYSKSKWVDFIHHSIEVNTGIHGHGLIAKEFIPMGTVIMIENPWLNFKHNPIISFNNNEYMEDDQLKQFFNDLEKHSYLKDFYDTFPCNNAFKSDKKSINESKFIQNEYGGSIYGYLLKLNHGYPTNIVIFGGDECNIINDNDNNDDILYNDKILVMTSNDINKGDELLYDYFNVSDQSMDYNLANMHEIIIDDHIRDFLHKYNGKVNNEYLNENELVNDIELIHENRISHSNIWFIPNEDKIIGQRKYIIKRMIGTGISENYNLFRNIAHNIWNVNDWNNKISNMVTQT